MKNPFLFSLAAVCLLGGTFTAVSAVVGCAHPTAAGIEPMPDTSFFGRRAKRPVPAEEADMAVVFVGGFTESTMAHFRSAYETMPQQLCKGRRLRAFYDWEGEDGNLISHSTERLQRDLRAFMQRNPRADIVLLGHSDGGSAVMDALRHLRDVTEYGCISVITPDPVSRFEASAPRERAPQVDVWLNAYCAPYRTPVDVVPMLGGSWGHCPQSDENFVYPGTERDANGRRFRHRHPLPLLMEPSPLQGTSPYEELLRRLTRTV